ncbi:MAG: PEP-CTERM sorting domain-containing protein [Verrucomicrobia bacterium]|nr:PEP-CTERM sorting domain-containing protein [Verrucomicrobiota bacterium]
MTTKTNIMSLLFAAGLAATSSAAVSSVVYGNLGVNEDAVINNTNTVLTSSVLRAQGFTTGNTALTIQTIKLGLSADTSTNVSVSIYSNISNRPGNLLFTSSSVSVSDQGTYSFSFTGAELLAVTSYWVRPDSDIRWHISGDESSPEELNGSGYAFLGTKQSSNSGSTWSNSSLPYSVSIAAVPEPSSALLGALGMLALVRRRR